MLSMLAGRPRAAGSVTRSVPVHLPERVREQLEALAVGTAEVQRHAVDLEVLDAGVVEPLPQHLPLGGLDADRQVVVAAEHLPYGAEVEAGEVEEGQGVAVADVEEEVRRARVVAVLEQLGQREAEEPLVEVDRPSRRRSRCGPCGARRGRATPGARPLAEVAGPQAPPLGGAIGPWRS